MLLDGYRCDSVDVGACNVIEVTFVHNKRLTLVFLNFDEVPFAKYILFILLIT